MQVLSASLIQQSTNDTIANSEVTQNSQVVSWQLKFETQICAKTRHRSADYKGTELQPQMMSPGTPNSWHYRGIPDTHSYPRNLVTSNITLTVSSYQVIAWLQISSAQTLIQLFDKLPINPRIWGVASNLIPKITNIISCFISEVRSRHHHHWFFLKVLEDSWFSLQWFRYL